LAWDYIDRLKETLTGKGTTHRFNGIAVQAKVYGTYVPKASLSKIDKQKQRTVTMTQDELPVYMAGGSIGPYPQLTVSTATDKSNKAMGVSNNKNLLRVIFGTCI